MMEINCAGFLNAKDFSPYVYFIKRDYLLYIGETQRNPVQRWSEHLSEDGSFHKAILKIDEEILTKRLPTCFYAYNCAFIEERISTVERRRATQYVEHELHKQVICQGIPLENELKIISNTVRTAPLNYGYAWLDEYVNLLYKSFVRDLTNYTLSKS